MICWILSASTHKITEMPTVEAWHQVLYEHAEGIVSRSSLPQQVCWEKLFNYFEIEPRYINLTEDCFVATPEKIVAACDENTIGVVAIMGTTYSGHFEDVAGISAALGAALAAPSHVEASLCG